MFSSFRLCLFDFKHTLANSTKLIGFGTKLSRVLYLPAVRAGLFFRLNFGLLKRFAAKKVYLTRMD